jgi:signal peptidase I
MAQQITTKAVSKPSLGKEIFDTIVVIVEALLIAFVFRSFVYQPFSIPSASMQSTLLIGDYVIANKWAWGYGRYSTAISGELFGTAFSFGELPVNARFLQFNDPKQGEVAVFRPVPQKEDYIKRIIGLPGDRIQMKQGRLYINGTMVERTEIGTAMDTDSRGDTFPVKVYRETLPNGVVHTIQEISDSEGLDDTSEYTVPAGHYFMMGDNRDQSTDSRVLSAVGYVPAVNLIGKAEARFFSIRDNAAPWQIWNWPTAVRWDRMFQSIYQ